MTDFLTTALTFPTVVYSVLLAVCLIYWLLAATGLMDHHAPDALLHGHLHGGDLHGHGDHHAEASDLAALLGRLGLAGVPVMVIATVLSFFGWMCAYYAQLLVLDHLHTTLRVAIGIAVDVAALVPGLIATSIALRPVSRWILKLRPPVEPSLLGRVAVVSTPVVDDRYGQARVDDGGAGLILQVRTNEPGRYKRGDRVVLIEFLDAQHAYRVVPEHQFHSL
ncbi:OB-fold-containig protein [Cognatilysobacter terrigena]|uniref:OB-fold-containig protein n=1 Tax=Cognatilysobacter terrigena TaxID=2488749 RepID=UPI00106075DF|nr:OB-fold-containig protein [Lysobacter terrigena]